MATLLEDPNATKEPRRKRRRLPQAVLGVTLLALIMALGLYLTSNSFRDRVRFKVISELEATTGGRVELQGFHWNLSRLEIVADNLTIHGLEKPGEIPYAHVDHLVVRAKILSVLQRDIGLRYVRVENPVIHIVTYPDGSTNQPNPKISQQANHGELNELFNLRLGHLEAVNGLFIWNDSKAPLNFVADDVAAGMQYRATGKSYDSKVKIGKLTLNYLGPPNINSHVEANLRLRSGSIEVPQLHWATASSSMEASGSIADFHNPKVNAKYRASLDLIEAARLLRLPALRRGTLDLNGQINLISPENFLSTGRLQLKNLEWSGPSAHVAGVDGSADFSLNPNRAVASHIVAHALGGTLSGNAQVVGWTRAAKKKGSPQGSASFDVAGLQLAQAVNAMARNSPLNPQVKLASDVNGKVELQWSGPPANADAKLMLDLTAPANPPRAALPLHGSVDLTYHGSTQRIDVRKLNLASREIRLDAVGALGATSHPNAALRVNVNTTNWSELGPVLQAAGGIKLPAIDIHGHASFSGNVTGQLRTPSLTGRLEISDFDTLLPPPANAAVVPASSSSPAPNPANPERIHWDSFTANVLYSPLMLAIKNGVLRQGAAQITVNGSAGFDQSKFTGASPINAQIKIANAEIKNLQLLTGRNSPATGAITADAVITGTMDNLWGFGNLQATGGEIYGRPYQSLQSHFTVQRQNFQFTNLLLKMKEGSVRGGAGYNLETKAFGLDLRGDHFNLADFVPANSAVDISGTGDFRLNGSGTLDQPTINANAVLHGVKLNQQPAGEITIAAATAGDHLHLTGRSSLENPAFAMDGDVHLRDDFPANVKLTVQNLDIQPLIAGYMPGTPPLHSLITGSVALDGPLKRPRLLHAEVNIPQLSATVENLNIHNDGPVRFSVRDRALTIEQFHIVGTDTDLYAVGNVDLGNALAMKMRANGRVNLKVLQTLDPNILSYGSTDFELDANGTFSHPELNGKINIHNAGISIVDAPNGLTEMNGTLIFEQDHLRVETLTARTGGGNLDLTGFVRYDNGLFFDLTGTSREVRIRYPQGMSSQADARLHFLGTTQNALLSGDILIVKFGMSSHFDLTQYLARTKKPPVPANPNSVVDNIRLDLHVTSTPELQVETSLAKLSGDVDLRLKGTVANPSVLGRVNIADGDVFFNTTRYHLERGDVTFSNPVQIQPIINLDASTRVRDYDITLGFHGTPENLNTSYRSEPPLPTPDILALLAFGQTNTQNQQQTAQQSFSETASNAILGEALNTVVSNRVQNLFGISKVKIDPAANTAENPNARLLTVEQQISNKVTVTYSPNLNQTGQQVISVEYNINPNISILAIRDQNGIFGMDLRIRQRKR